MVLVRQSLDAPATQSTHQGPTQPPADWASAGAMSRGYSIVEDEEGSARPRISAISASGVEIAGAFQPPQRPYWLLYATPLLAAAAGIEFRHDPIPLGSRDGARQWVNLVAQLYVKAAA